MSTLGYKNGSSGSGNPIVAFFSHAIHRADDTVGLDSHKSLELEREIERLIHEDKDMDRRVRELVMELKLAPVEPETTLILRASIRPIITISLTITFIILMLVPVFGDPDQAEHFKEMLPIFLGIYGSVIGFWFGEHTAQKQAQQK